MKPVETYDCLDCGNQMYLRYATWDKPTCDRCGEHLNVIETTNWRLAETV